MNDTRQEALGQLIGDLGEIQARVLHLLLAEQKAGLASDALSSAVGDLEAVVENLRRAATE